MCDAKHAVERVPALVFEKLLNCSTRSAPAGSLVKVADLIADCFCCIREAGSLQKRPASAHRVTSPLCLPSRPHLPPLTH